MRQPRPGSLSTSIEPPSADAIRDATAKPNPPRGAPRRAFDRKNGRNRCGSSSGVIPQPRSSTSSRTPCRITRASDLNRRSRMLLLQCIVDECLEQLTEQVGMNRGRCFACGRFKVKVVAAGVIVPQLQACRHPPRGRFAPVRVVGRRPRTSPKQQRFHHTPQSPGLVQHGTQRAVLVRFAVTPQRDFRLSISAVNGVRS